MFQLYLSLSGKLFFRAFQQLLLKIDIVKRSYKDVYIKCTVPKKTILWKISQTIPFFVTFVIFVRSVTLAILTSIGF